MRVFQKKHETVQKKYLKIVSEDFLMRDLYLIRHGKPQYPDEHSYCIGQTDLPLSMLGHLQAVLLHEELSDKISAIYCSPLSRAVDTASHIAPALPHLTVSELSERNLGSKPGEMILTIRSPEQKLLLHPVHAFHRRFPGFFILRTVILRLSLIRM